jgi:hypothetical protein
MDMSFSIYITYFAFMTSRLVAARVQSEIELREVMDERERLAREGVRLKEMQQQRQQQREDDARR